MRSLHGACAILVLLCILPMIFGQKGCEGCGSQCDKCTYGSGFVEYCNKVECMKGPDELCGGKLNIYGKCGEGMYCKCNYCAGCSIHTLKCAEKNLIC